MCFSNNHCVPNSGLSPNLKACANSPTIHPIMQPYIIKPIKCLNSSCLIKVDIIVFDNACTRCIRNPEIASLSFGILTVC